MGIVGNFKEALQEKNQTEIDFLILLRKARKKNLCYCFFPGSTCDKNKKVVYTPLLLILSPSQKEWRCGTGTWWPSHPQWVWVGSFYMGVQSWTLFQLRGNLAVTYADHPKILGIDPLSCFCRLNHIPASIESSSSSCRQYKLVAVLIIWSSVSIFPDVKDFFILVVKEHFGFLSLFPISYISASKLNVPRIAPWHGSWLPPEEDAVSPAKTKWLHSNCVLGMIQSSS